MNTIISNIEPYLGGNTIQDIYIALGMFVVIYLAVWILKHQVLARLSVFTKNSKMKVDDMVVQILDGLGTPFFFIVALYASVQHLQLPSIVTKLINGVFLLMMVYEVIKVLEKIIVFFLSRNLAKGTEGRQISAVITFAVRVVLWSIGLILILSNLGINVTSLVASLGIGGIAISLALQNILSDIFSSFSILIDKPFKEGDFIIVGEHKGEVKHIGLKTTRIQALQGEEIVISNNELTTARVQNFKQMKQRRIVFSLGVTYDTPVTKVKKIPTIVKKIINDQKDVKFDRAHFKEFGDFSLNFEFVYYLKSNEYSVYMKTQQAVNLEIMEAFEKEQIEFAFPTQTVYVAKGE